MEIDINPLGQIDGVTVKGEFTDLFISARQKKVIVFFDVVPIDADGNEINNDITGRYTTSNTADNSTIVYKKDGSFVDTTAIPYKFNPDTMCGQFDFFMEIMNTQPVIVTALIGQYLQLAKDTESWNPKG